VRIGFKAAEAHRSGGLISCSYSGDHFMNALTDTRIVQSQKHFRTQFLSDVHLGMKGCLAELLLDFLHCHDTKTHYLVAVPCNPWKPV